VDPQTRTFALRIVLGWVPDLIICWVVARLTDSGWSGFFITLAALQAIYFFLWLKGALWGVASVLALRQAADGGGVREILHRWPFPGAR
jgi:hypothetical protein